MLFRSRKKTQENNYPNLGSIHSELVLWKDNRKLAVFFYKIIFKLLSVTNHINKRKYLNYYTFLVFNQPYLAKYVSDKNINCFIWKNPDISDKVFFKYLDCIKKNSKHSKVEIEIKKTECF